MKTKNQNKKNATKAKKETTFGKLIKQDFKMISDNSFLGYVPLNPKTKEMEDGGKPVAGEVISTGGVKVYSLHTARGLSSYTAQVVVTFDVWEEDHVWVSDYMMDEVFKCQSYLTVQKVTRNMEYNFGHDTRKFPEQNNWRLIPFQRAVICTSIDLATEAQDGEYDIKSDYSFESTAGKPISKVRVKGGKIDPYTLVKSVTDAFAHSNWEKSLYPTRYHFIEGIELEGENTFQIHLGT